MGGEPPAGEESALLTAPGRRDDLHEDDEVHHYKKGRTYKTVAADGRRGSGPTRRHLRSMATPETVTYSSPVRSRTGASVGVVKTTDLGLGKTDFKSLIGLEEQNESIYNKSETRMIENTMKVRRLVEQLENKEADNDET